MTDAPGDAIVMLSECRDSDQGTLDNIHMLDCPWLSQYLFVTLGKWFVTNWEYPVSGRHAETLLGTGRNSFDGRYSTGIYTCYVSGFCARV